MWLWGLAGKVRNLADQQEGQVEILGAAEVVFCGWWDFFFSG